MYFFLINLSALRILFTTTTISKILSLLLLGDCFLSFPACFLQLYLFYSFSYSEAFILVVMAYDRYVAVCHPLHYPVLMTPQTNAALAACVCSLPSSGPPQWWCRLPTWLLTTLLTSITPQALMGFCIAMAVSFLPLVLVLLSYAHILASVLRICSREGRSEDFSTCSSHLLVVGTYYLSIAIAYVAYSANLPLDFHIMGNVVYAILIPVLNPLIYEVYLWYVDIPVRKVECVLPLADAKARVFLPRPV
uniref:Olfactory receptor n=1 Tax=Felis catus TaxID=9685 RepID=A0ABI7Z3Q8_FELCA